MMTSWSCCVASIGGSCSLYKLFQKAHIQKSTTSLFFFFFFILRSRSIRLSRRSHRMSKFHIFRDRYHHLRGSPLCNHRCGYHYAPSRGLRLRRALPLVAIRGSLRLCFRVQALLSSHCNTISNVAATFTLGEAPASGVVGAVLSGSRSDGVYGDDAPATGDSDSDGDGDNGDWW